MGLSNTSWVPGQSGNPGGRPRIVEAVRDIARESTMLAIETLRQIAADTDAASAARVSAATALLDRAWGKPLQGVAMLHASAPKSVREMTDEQLMALMVQKTDSGERE